MHCAKKPIEANNYSPLERDLWSSPLIGTLADPIDTIHDNEERLGQGGSEDWPEAVDAPQDQQLCGWDHAPGIRAISVATRRI